MSCATALVVGPPLFGDSAVDPWVATGWRSDANGHAGGTAHVEGFVMGRLLGHAVVVHGSSAGAFRGGGVACGVLGTASVPAASARFAPRGAGGSGRGIARFYADDSAAAREEGTARVRLEFDVFGLPPSSAGRFRLHTGQSCTLLGGASDAMGCDGAAAVGEGALCTWRSGADGSAVGTALVTSSYSLRDTLGRPLAILAPDELATQPGDGALRVVACGVVGAGAPGSVGGAGACGPGTEFDELSGLCRATGPRQALAVMASYPGYAGATAARGQFTVAAAVDAAGEGGVRVGWRLRGPRGGRAQAAGGDARVDACAVAPLRRCAMRGRVQQQHTATVQHRAPAVCSRRLCCRPTGRVRAR